MKKSTSLNSLLVFAIVAALVALPAGAQLKKIVPNAIGDPATWTIGTGNGARYNGHIALGTDTGPYTLLVQDPSPSFAFVASTGTNSAYATFVNTAGGAYFGMENSAGNRIVDNGASPYALVFQSAPNRNVQFATGVAAASVRMTIAPNGFVGIGLAATAAPVEMLDIAGNVNVTGNIAAKYQDVAEWVPSSGLLPAGTVVTLDRNQNNHVLASTRAYDSAVAGVVSSKPGLILGESGDDKSIVATTGRVKVHVDASKHPIAIGDLLVSSDEPGLAMRSEPVDLGGVKFHRPGTIIGKALEPLPAGEGSILVLLSLQ